MSVNYFLLHHKTDLVRILKEDDISKHYSINIHFLELFSADVNLGKTLLSHPESILSDLDSSLITVQKQLLEEGKNFVIKQNIHARVYGLPVYREQHKNLMPTNENVGSFLQVSGTVVRITLPKMLEYQRQYICVKCKYKIIVKADLQQRCIIIPPESCTNQEVCKSNKFILDDKFNNTGSCKDYQEIKIQEQASKLAVGKIPNSLWITVEDDLVDICKPGDNVTICGIVYRRWKQLQINKKFNVELFLKANHIQVNNDNSLNLLVPDMKEHHKNFWLQHAANPFEGRHIIAKSICPELYGLFITKLALAVVLAGGSHLLEKEDTVTSRSHPHLLLVGDPGTGKSELLRFASKIIRRSVLTTGIGSTSAGLTATAVMEDGDWHLEGGALVMADGGICCIDEFNSMKKQDLTSIHEAMEQQTISVAKAGVVCKLRTRCTVLAAMNPKCKIDRTQSSGININIASPLLSRFDLVLHLKDNMDEEYDALMADHILGIKKNIKENNLWNIEKLQSYFIMIKQLHPILTTEASIILSCYYQAQREIISRNKARTTVRLLDSLIRLSEGHARLMFRNEVQISDAIVAVLLVDVALQGDSPLLLLNDLNSDFPEDASVFQNTLNCVVLHRLNLMHLLESENRQTEKIENSQSLSSHKMSSSSSSKEVSFETTSSISSCSESDHEISGTVQHNKNTDISDSSNSDTSVEENKKERHNCIMDESEETTGNSLYVHENFEPTSKRLLFSEAQASMETDLTEKSPLKTRYNSVSKVKDSLRNFRFKPHTVAANSSSTNQGIDFNHMLNMIPSVAEDFNVDELVLDDLSGQSETLDKK